MGSGVGEAVEVRRGASCGGAKLVREGTVRCAGAVRNSQKIRYLTC